MPAAKPHVEIRDLKTISDLRRALQLEKQVWGLEDADVTPLTHAVATQAAGALWVGAFRGEELVGIAYAFPSLRAGRVGLHSHLLAVQPSHRESGVGYRLKLAQRERALALGIAEISWTFDPLRSLNAHLNFTRLRVISDTYRTDFYGPETSSPLHRNGTDRLWVTWRLTERRVEERLRGADNRSEVLDALQHLEPLVRFNGDGQPILRDVSAALARQRVAIEIPGDTGAIERDNVELARQWRSATRVAFTSALEAGFTVTEFCRWIRGQQGPGAYLLEKAPALGLT
jgi:predicted GNAT superfamily acetyltransferase